MSADGLRPKNPGAIEAARALPLAGLLAVQAGSVVSRTLKKDDKGTLTLFAFDKDEGLSEHAAPFDAYVLVLEGRLEIRIGGKPVAAAAGDLVLMPGGIPHALEALTPAKMLLVMIRS